MESIHETIKDSFDVISLLLIFAFVLFDIRYPQIKHSLDQDIPPPERKIERRRHLEKLRKTLLIGDLPLVVIYALLVFLFLPLFLELLSQSNLKLWGFDFLLSAFMIVFLLLVAFLAWSLYLGIRLWKRISETD